MSDKRTMETHGDEFYELLMKAHEGLSEPESQALNARLVLLMADEINEVEKLAKIVTSAIKYE